MPRGSQLERGYTPLLVCLPDIKGMIAFASSRPINDIADGANRLCCCRNRNRWSLREACSGWPKTQCRKTRVARQSGTGTVVRTVLQGAPALVGGADPRREGLVLGDGEGP